MYGENVAAVEVTPYLHLFVSEVGYIFLVLLLLHGNVCNSSLLPLLRHNTYYCVLAVKNVFVCFSRII
jgi:hypothetical protein